MRDGRRSRWLAAVAAALVVAASNGCGGSGGSGGNGISDPTPPVATPWPPQVVSSVGGASLQAQYMGRMVFTTARAGALEATVDWTYASNDIDALIVTGDCSYEQLDAEQCSILGMAVSTTAKPEKFQVANAPAGTYTIFIGNLGPGDETISYQVVLTPSATASVRVQPLRFEWKQRFRGSVELR